MANLTIYSNGPDEARTDLLEWPDHYPNYALSHVEARELRDRLTAFLDSEGE